MAMRSAVFQRREMIFVIGSVFLLFLLSATSGRASSGGDAPAPPQASGHMCEADGTCHERAFVASPRTEYSGRAEQWAPVHEALREAAAGYRPARRPLVLLGDSITELWRGTSYGEFSERAVGCPELLRAKFPSYSPVALAISGDQTQHLLWRLRHGELPPAAAKNGTFIVHIGTNNLGSGHLPSETARGVAAVVGELLAETRGRVVLLALLPRGDGPSRLPALCPPRCAADGAPFVSFAPAVARANADVAAAIKGKDRVELVDCGGLFLKAGTTEIDAALMPDLLHPSVAGMAKLADCLLAKSRFLTR